jgi:CarD family transcriptional regulator
MKVAAVGMRKLAEEPMVRRALETLKGRARIKRTMWSRRAQEYEAKINSGNIVAISEVVRDLYRSDTQPEQSYSERQLYEAALDRLSREISAVQRITETEAIKEIEAALAKGPRRGGPKAGRGRGCMTGSRRLKFEGPANAGPFVFPVVVCFLVFLGRVGARVIRPRS